MASLRSHRLTTIDEVKQEILHVVERQKPGTPQDLTHHRDEVDELLRSFSDYLPEWGLVPSVFRVARLEVGEELLPGTPWHYRAGILPVCDNTVLPDVKHQLPMVVEMLNYIREKRGLERIKMPLFLQPDEVFESMRYGRDDGGDRVAEEPEPVFAERPRPSAPDLLEPPSRPKRRGRRGRRRHGPEDLRRAVHDRHGWRCSDCGEKWDLHLHRVDESRPDDDPSAYVTLCRPCLLRTQGGALRVGAAASVRGYELTDEATLDDLRIRSQLAVVFHKARIAWVGFVFGKRFVLLRN
jgi:hypothetical protein